MVPIYVWWDEGSEKYLGQVLDGLKLVLREGMNISPHFPIKTAGSQGVEDYFSRAERRTGYFGWQYDATDILRFCETEPFQEIERHVEFGFTGKDLYAHNTDFVYGATNPLHQLSFQRVGNDRAGYRILVPGTLLSYRRIDYWYKDSAPRVFSKMVVHECSHIFDVPARRFNVEHSLGKHCIRADCVMGQVNVKRNVLKDGRINVRFIDALESTKNVEERERETGSSFCEDCMRDLTESKNHFLNLLFG